MDCVISTHQASIPPIVDLQRMLTWSDSARRALGPYFDSKAAFGSSVYRLHGSDTLTWGPVVDWVQSKSVMSDVLQALNCARVEDMNEPCEPMLYTAQTVAKIRAALSVAPAEARGPETSAQFLAAIDHALAHDQPVLARTLAQQGHLRDPQNEYLARLARVLAPPRTITADLPPDPDVIPNWAWLDAHSDQYVGQWVAIQGGDLKGAAPTVRELKTAVGDLRGMFVTRVL